MKSVELFTGAGGLALGCGLAGFAHLALVERDPYACDTVRENQRRNYPLLHGWALHQGDVRSVDWACIRQEVDLVAGGPPCQPFSIGGKHQGHADARDMFPATVAVIRALRPRAFIIENVRGITRPTFANYFQYVQLQLEFAQLPEFEGEGWQKHFRRLQEEKTSGASKGSGLTYNLVPTLVNAADYGVPQKRERVFLVGFRDDLGVEWSFPEPTHSSAALLHDQWVSGAYWRRHGLPMPAVPTKLRRQVAHLKHNRLPVAKLPWRTVRDAICDLPPPQSAAAKSIFNHQFQAGARVYPGHTGSPLDAPAKTLKSGDHGVPGGENMLVRDDASVRYFTVRESARLQTFPDGFVFHGSWTETMRQLGNAVPVLLAQRVAVSVAEKLLQAQDQSLRQSMWPWERLAA